MTTKQTSSSRYGVSGDAARTRSIYESRYSERTRSTWYSRWSPRNPPAIYYRHVVELALVRALNELAIDLSGAEVLDVGCGPGIHLRFLAELGAAPERLHGVDLVPERIDAARYRSPAMDLTVADATNLPFADAAFDVVTQFTCMSSVTERGLRRRVATEMHRVLRPGGQIVWFDMAGGPGGDHYRPVPPDEIASLFPTLRVLTARPLLHRWTSRLVRFPEACALVERLPVRKTNLLTVLG